MNFQNTYYPLPLRPITSHFCLTPPPPPPCVSPLKVITKYVYMYA